MLFCNEIYWTEQALSNLDRVYKIFIIGIWRIHPSFFNCSLEHMKPKVNIFDGKKKNAISTSGFPNKWTFYILVILL